MKMVIEITGKPSQTVQKLEKYFFAEPRSGGNN